MSLSNVVAYVFDDLSGELLISEVDPVEVEEFVILGHQENSWAVIVQDTFSCLTHRFLPTRPGHVSREEAFFLLALGLTHEVVFQLLFLGVCDADWDFEFAQYVLHIGLGEGVFAKDEQLRPEQLIPILQ